MRRTRRRSSCGSAASSRRACRCWAWCGTWPKSNDRGSASRIAGEEIDYLYCNEADWDADFNGVEDADAEGDLALYLAELEAVRGVASDYTLDDTFVHPRLKQKMSVRWVYVHMIEEYARHNGHADLLRERIDGVTGRVGRRRRCHNEPSSQLPREGES